MSGLPTTSDLLARHKAYLPTHIPIPTFAELIPQGKVPHVAVVSCADPRSAPEKFLGITVGDAVIFRNAGANIQTALPNILAIDSLLGLDEIIVVKHTDCGSLAFTNEGVKEILNERAPGKAVEIEKMEFGSINGKTLQGAIQEQIAAVKASGLLREEVKPKIRGFVYDLESGDLKEVEV